MGRVFFLLCNTKMTKQNRAAGTGTQFPYSVRFLTRVHTVKNNLSSSSIIYKSDKNKNV